MQHINHERKHYIHLLIMAGLSFIAMYILMYTMVDRLNNVYPNFNQFYMAGLMTAPMVIIELLVMKAMYANKKLNTIILTTAILAGLIFFMGIRQQAFVSDQQFLKSMIPHHAGALLMCEEAPITDHEIIDLCVRIKSGQQQEIDQMNGILNRLSK